MAMTNYHAPVEMVAERLSACMMGEVEKAIKQALMVHAEEIVNRLAKEMAAGLKGNITAFHDFKHSSINMTISIDGVKEVLEK